jgi:hypothetical protein
MKNALNFFIVFLLMFDIRMPNMPNGVGVSVVLMLIFMIVILAKGKHARFLSVWNTFSPIFYLHIVAFLYISLRVLFGGVEDPGIMLAGAKSFIIFFAIFLYWVLFEYVDDHAPELVINVFFFNAIICFVAGSIPEILNIVRVFQNEALTEESQISYRNAFLSGSGFFSVGTAYGLTFLFSIYVFFVKAKKFSYIRGGQLILISVAGFIAARTSILAVLLGLTLLLILKIQSLVKVILISLVPIFIFILTPELHLYNSWLFELFQNGLEGDSASALRDSMYFSPTVFTLIFGDGKHNIAGGFYGGSDIGYIRNILFAGIPYLFIIILFPVFMAYRLTKIGWMFSLCVFIVLLGFHGKGSFIYNNAQGMAVFYMMYAYFSRLSMNKQNNLNLYKTNSV